MNKLIVRFALSLMIALATASLTLAQSSDYVKARGLVSTDGVRPGDKFRVAIALDIAKGFHVNSNKPKEQFLIPTSVTFEPAADIRIGEVKYPAATLIKLEKVSATELAVYEGTVYIIAEAEADKSIQAGPIAIRARLNIQACDDAQCFPPDNVAVEIPVQIVAAKQAVKETNADEFARAVTGLTEPNQSGAGGDGALVEFKSNTQPPNRIAELMESGGIVLALLGIFVAGLALNLTPCVYPIIPITIGFFANQGSTGEGSPRLRRTFAMASVYVLGMAMTYSILGVVAAMSGELFGAALQKPIVLINIAAIMIALSLSMFGVYEFKVPESLNRLATKSTQATSGIIGALVMGLMMGIIAAPCIGPFVLSLLIFVGEKGDPALGFLLFFVLALGLGFPYLILGTFSGAIKALPRSGLWMVTVRKVFGLVLIGMALYFLMPLLGADTKLVFIEFFLLSAIYLLLFEAGRTKQKQFAWALRGIGVAAAAVAIWMAVPKPPEPTVVWQPYSEQALIAAKTDGKAVIIDAYADWCTLCKELDRWTFTNGDVAKESEKFVTLKLDLTNPAADSDASRARKLFNIRGLPTVIFIDPSGAERADLRLNDFEKAGDFLARMKKIDATPAQGGETLAQNAAPATGALSDVAPSVAPNGAEANPAVTEKTAEGQPSTAAPVEPVPEKEAAPVPVVLSNEINEPLPAANLSLLKGGALNLGSLRGKVVVLSFWATWCVPCIQEIPIFNQLSGKYRGQGLQVIAVGYPDEGPDLVKEFLKKHPMNFLQALGSEDQNGAFRISDDRPDVLIIDKQGRIRFRHNKLTKKEVLEAEINKLLGE